MKKIALVIVAVLILTSTANAQKRVKRRYVQRIDPYAQFFSDWATALQPEYSGIDRNARIGGSGMAVGTDLTCNDCGTAGHYSCGARLSTCVVDSLRGMLMR
jgi:hypothetical protein